MSKLASKIEQTPIKLDLKPHSKNRSQLSRKTERLMQLLSKVKKTFILSNVMLSYIEPKERVYLQLVCKHWYDTVIPIGL